MKVNTWFTASVDYYLTGAGFKTKNFYMKAVSKRAAREKMKAYVRKRFGKCSLYNLGSEGNREINNLARARFSLEMTKKREKK